MSKYRNVDHHRFTSVARQKERLLQHDAFGTGIIGGRSSTKNVFFFLLSKPKLRFDHFIALYTVVYTLLFTYFIFFHPLPYRTGNQSSKL